VIAVSGRCQLYMTGTGTFVRGMTTKVAMATLAVAAITLAGCQNAKAGTTQPAAAPAPSSAPASNGITALSADEILKKATGALTAAKAYRVQGDQLRGRRTTEIDFKVSGKDFASSMTAGKSHLELLFIGGKQYMRPNEQFWIDALDARQGKALAKVIGGRWVTGNKRDKSFEEMFRIGSAEQFLKPNGTLSKDAEKEIDGVAAIGLKDADDAVLYVATTGEPYPLRLVGKGGVALKFSEFGVPSSDFKTPAEDDVVNLDALQGK
jgi:hypothetical protein